jgi:spermidine synthase
MEDKMVDNKLPDKTISRASLGYLMLTALLCGAMVMVIEVMGSRLIGPFFGVSLYVWTSLIAVTMMALAGGYAIGGVIADRRGTADTLYLIILSTGLELFLVPLLKGPILNLCYPLGLRLGAFTSALLLLGPSLFLLGCVSPFLVKLATRELDKIGRTVGGFYALSTIGSVLGTVIAGFVLIAYFGVEQIFGLVGSLLVTLAVVYFLVFRKKWLAVAAFVVPVLLFPGGYTPGTSRLLDNGTLATSIVAQDSHYGSLKVVDYTYKQVHTREMVIDGLIQGAIDMKTGESVYSYSYFLERIPRALNPSGTSCLVIGLGAGLVPRYYEKLGVRTDVVDIDPGVVKLARDYFGYDLKGDVYIEDARYFLKRSEEQYDYVILDVFSGDTTPGYLISREAVALLAARLTEGGVLGINLVGSLKRDTFMTASVIKTLRTAFDQVEIYPTFSVDKGKGWGNLEVMAYMGPPRSFDRAELTATPMHWLAQRDAGHLIGTRFEFPEDTPAIVLSDDYNPLDVYDAWLRESVRSRILESTPWDLLIEST